jgi:Retroviral aspartyl protease
MRFKGFIDKIPICALIDSGSTHSFVDSSILHGHHFLIEETHALIVMVDNEARTVTYSKCTTLTFTLKGHKFMGDFRLLQI